MIKLQFSKRKYYTFSDGKVVVCSYDCTVYDSSDGRILQKFKVKGKATCAEQDMPNPYLGRMIADSRAKEKAYTKARTLFDKEELEARWKEVTKTLDEFRFFDQMSYLRRNEQVHIKKLINEDNY